MSAARGIGYVILGLTIMTALLVAGVTLFREWKERKRND